MFRDESLLQMYAGGKPNRKARFMNDLTAKVFSLGLGPHWAVSLEIANPKSGKSLTLPLVIANYGGREYLVSMLGQGSRWVRYARDGGRAIIRAGRRRPVLLEEVPAGSRAPILKEYLARAPGARPHIPVDMDEPVANFERIAADYPVFEVHYL